MKNLIIALALLLGACTINNPITTDRLVTVESSYGVLLSAAVAYRNACAAKTINSSCRPIVVKLQSADRQAQAALTEARKYRGRTDLIATDAIQLAASAVEIFNKVVDENGVPK